MTAFEVYQIYTALRLHFTDPKYDIAVTKGRMANLRDAFDKKRDTKYMYKLASEYTRKEIIDILIANFITGETTANIYTGNFVDNYKKLLTNRKRMLYNLDTDLDNILFRMEKEKIKSACKEGQHPLIFRMYMGGDIHLESLVIMEKLYPYVEDYKTDFVLEHLCLLITKYKPFVRFDKNIVVQKYTGKMLQCLSQ
jgi:hypothetical protein